MALGIMAVIVGAESLLIDSASLYSSSETQPSSFMNPGMAPSRGIRVWTPGEAFPWVLLAVGGVVILYAITLPKRWGHAAHG
jgi:hypothetical protein